MPCRTVGGDFFDYLELGERGFGFALGDVAGKGPPAALLAAAVQSNFVAQAPVSGDPADTMARINKALLRRAIEARFATMFYGVVDADGSLQLLQRRTGAAAGAPARTGMEWLETGGPVLGLLTVATYECDNVALEPGDLVVVCSDGVTEARNAAGDEFGRERLVEAMERCHGMKPDAVLDACSRRVRTFSEGDAAGRRHHRAGVPLPRSQQTTSRRLPRSRSATAYKIAGPSADVGRRTECRSNRRWRATSWSFKVTATSR